MEVLVIPDPLPSLRPSGDGSVIKARPLVVAICGWGQDEPIEDLLASAVGRPWHLAITGRPRATPELPRNVQLTGFLEDEAYGRLLESADLVVVLTTRDETLLSGAWEALALAAQ